MTDDIILRESEKVLWETKKSPIVIWLFSLGSLIVFTIPIITLVLFLYHLSPKIAWFTIPEAILLFVLATVQAVLCVKNTRITVTNQRLIYKLSMMFRTSVKEQPLDKIENVEFKISKLGEKFNYGEVKVTGTGGDPITMDYILEPERTRQSIIAAKKNL
jgi:hypothetical protein